MSGIEPVLLKTDVLFFVLIAAMVAYGSYARRHEHLRAPWRQVARQPLGMAAAVVLAVYLAIAFLDSLHFRASASAPHGGAGYSHDLNSVFDVLVTPLRDSVERTYSAPFAAEARKSLNWPTVPTPVPIRASSTAVRICATLPVNVGRTSLRV